MRGSKNNILAGVFVVLTLVGIFVIALTLAKAGDWTASRSTYTVQFSLVDGAVGLKEGSQVKVGGQSVGVVRTVDFVKDSAGTPTMVNVVVGIRSDLTLYKDADFYLELPLLGTVSTINIPKPGTPAAGKLMSGDSIRGTLSPPAFLAQAGYGEDQRKQLQSILKRGETVAGDIENIIADLRKRFGPTAESVLAFIEELRGTVKNVQEWIAKFGPKLDKGLDTANATLDQAKVAAKNLDEGIAQGRKFIADAQSTLDTNRAKIDRIVSNVEEMSERAKATVLPEVEKAVASGRAALDEFKAAATRVSTLIDEQSPEVRLALSNIRLSSDQLKLTLTEVRRNPWRLLYQPGKKELEKELVYDAARSFATAASDLRAASASLEEITGAAKASGRAVDEKTIAELNRQLNESFKKYRVAEEQFLKQVLDGEK
jgi:ABC-type transporter Mla subunit MlaD